jgi:hypothetical protein
MFVLGRGTDHRGKALEKHTLQKHGVTMGIIATPSPTPTPPTLTIEQKQRKAKAIINAQINGLYRQMLSTYTAAMGLVWSNADGLTSQQVFDAFGTDGAELIRLATLLATTVNTATPGTIPAPTVNLQIGEDGKVTVA